MVKTKSLLRLARMQKGLTLTEASKLLGISKQYLSSMELGYEPISRHQAQFIKALYGLEVI